MRKENRGVRRRILRAVLYVTAALIALLSFASCETTTGHSCAFGGDIIDADTKSNAIVKMNGELNGDNDVMFFYLNADLSDAITIPEGRYVGICLNGKQFTSTVTVRDTDGDPSNNEGGVYTFTCGVHGIHGEKRFITVNQDIIDFFSASPKVYNKMISDTSSKLNIALGEDVRIDVSKFVVPAGATLTLCTNGYSSGLTGNDKSTLMSKGGLFFTFDCNADYYHECIHLPDDVHVIAQDDLMAMQTLLSTVSEGSVYVYLASDIEWTGVIAVHPNVNLVVCTNGFSVNGDYISGTASAGNIYFLDCSNHLCEGYYVTGKSLAINEDSIDHLAGVLSAVADVNAPCTVYAVLEDDIDVPVFDGIDLRVCLNGYTIRNSKTSVADDGVTVIGSVTYYNCASRHVCGVSTLWNYYNDPIFTNSISGIQAELAKIEADDTFDAGDIYFYNLTSDISGTGTVSAPDGALVGICLNGFDADGVTFSDNIFLYECRNQYCEQLKCTISAFDQGVFDFYSAIATKLGDSNITVQTNAHIAVSEDVVIKTNIVVADGYNIDFCSCGYTITNYEKALGSITYHDTCTPGSFSRKEACDECGMHAHDDTCVCEGKIQHHDCIMAEWAETMLEDQVVVSAPLNERRLDVINMKLAELQAGVIYFTYLTDDLVGSGALEVPDDIYLFICLNGYSMGDVTVGSAENVFVFECGVAYCYKMNGMALSLDQAAIDLLTSSVGADLFYLVDCIVLTSDVNISAEYLVLDGETTANICTNGYKFNVVGAETTEGYDPSKVNVHTCAKPTCPDCGTEENNWIPFNYSTYKAITDNEGVVNLPSGAYFFYLENDFQITAQLQVPAGIDLHICLNGYTLYSPYIWADENTCGSGYPEHTAMGVATVLPGATLNIHDCSPGNLGSVSLRYLRSDENGDGVKEIIISYSSDEDDNSIASQLGQSLGNALSAAFAHVIMNSGTVNVYGGSYNAMIAFINVADGVTNIYSGNVNAMFVGVLQIATESDGAISSPSLYMGDDVIVSAGFVGVIGVGGSEEIDGTTINAGILGVGHMDTTEEANSHTVINNATINCGHYEQIVNATEIVWVNSGGTPMDNPVVMVNSIQVVNFNAAVFSNSDIILDGEINTNVVNVSGTVETGSDKIISDFVFADNADIIEGDNLTGKYTVAVQGGNGIGIGDGENLKPAAGFMTRVNFESGELEIVPVPEGYKDRAKVEGISASTAGDVRFNIRVKFDVSDLSEEQAQAYLETVSLIIYYKGETSVLTIDDATATDIPYYYVFSLGTPAKDYREKIRFAFTDDDGCIQNVYETSVAEYLQVIMLNEGGVYNDKTVMLATALDNYCAAAAKHFGIATTYTPDEYIVEYMDMINAEYLKDYAAVRGETTEDNKATILGGTVLLKDTVTIRLFFKLDGADPSSIVATVDGVQVQILESDIPSRPYYIEITDIYAKDLDKMFEITIDGATVKYSVMSYAYSVISRPSSYTADMIDVVKAMCLYYEAAEIYTSGNAQEG